MNFIKDNMDYKNSLNDVILDIKVLIDFIEIDECDITFAKQKLERILEKYGDFK